MPRLGPGRERGPTGLPLPACPVAHQRAEDVPVGVDVVVEAPPTVICLKESRTAEPSVDVANHVGNDVVGDTLGHTAERRTASCRPSRCSAAATTTSVSSARRGSSTGRYDVDGSE